ncbi:prephenate dehydrogenase [Lederbergia wuyishanensis]|uniref:Prephenate dehydrogenase n=1 Tax=Lederbergia wuyishanensis TaxID=1347903 RepID=A0ABU0D0S7_9BACI|nr:prephenate dehydrogenase [Lederbergia wuyishanensis]MCJ8006626.1 prephenate dehydrogenase [Lederbergia wuyishanensis]MDQ0342007.1 prephenate dehydrogenase [Lederbergia wuyishanensis]
MDDLKRVLLVGVGLIGGSVALAIKKEHHVHIVGFDVKLDNCQLAKKLNIIDDFTEKLEEEASKADLIILACPVDKAEQILEKLSVLPLKEDVIITDVGSTKAKIMEKAEEYFNNGIPFIGGHPMAGSHKVGPGSARAHLFENAFYVLTPSQNATNGKIDILKKWLKGTNANFIIMDPKEHDLVTGVVSHFPHIVAASLVRQVENHASQNEHVKYLAAGGFRDITRIASSSPEMWRDIVKHNQPILLSLLDQWMSEMNEVRQLVEEGDNEELYHYFDGAKKYRDSLPVRAKGAITAFYDLYVDILDKPGVISDITTLLAQENISITNIRIIEAREDVYGVLRISFQTEKDLERAKVCLENRGYETYISM